VPFFAYRIVKVKWALSAFDGEAARRYGGRWNSVGTPMVYTSSSRSLAALEVLVHLEGPARGYSVIRCEIHDDVAVETIAEADLPGDWRNSAAPATLAAIGDAWVARGTSVVLKVPSAVVADESNYLLNPRHQDFGRISIHVAEPFPYDERLVALSENRKS